MDIGRRKFVIGTAASAVLAPSIVRAQGYPNRPVRFIVPLAAGGGLDFIARLVGEYISRGLGQQVFVENRTGAGGTIGIDLAIKRAAGRLFVAADQRQRRGRAARDEAERGLPQGPDAGEPARAPAAGVGGTSFVRREVDGRARRRSEKGRHDGLRDLGRRLEPARADGVVRQGRRHQARARSLSRRRTGDQRPARRPRQARASSARPRPLPHSAGAEDKVACAIR